MKIALAQTPQMKAFTEGLRAAGFLYFAVIGLVLSLIDLRSRRLPNRIVLPSYFIVFLIGGIGGALSGDPFSLLRSLLAALFMFATYLLIAFFSQGGMGFGDVKFAGVIGLFLGFLGWKQVIVGAVAAFVLGATFGLIVMAARKSIRKIRVAFGPWMVLGAWLGILFATPISRNLLTVFAL